MTIPEIITELERLKDYTNDEGKRGLSKIQDELNSYAAPLPAVPVVEASKPVVPVPVSTDRRSEDRDPGESDQRTAEKLKLVK